MGVSPDRELPKLNDNYLLRVQLETVTSNGVDTQQMIENFAEMVLKVFEEGDQLTKVNETCKIEMENISAAG
jgi:hypothetical protein